MTTIEFYKQLSVILESYRYQRNKRETAEKKLKDLNLKAKEAGLDLEAELSILDNLNNDSTDEEYWEDDDSYEEDDSYDASYDDESY